MTECWFRNPDLCIKELVECRAHNIVWDRGYVYKKRIDPVTHADLYFPPEVDFRLLLVGEQGAAELHRGETLDRPRAVYPVWEYGQEWDILEDIMANPVGENEHICSDTTVQPDERPVLGQEHRIVIIRPPTSGSGPGRKFFTDLRNLQLEYPECIVHVHGVYSYRIAFGLGFASADVEPRLLAKNGKVALPTGKEMLYEQTMRCSQWVTLLGFNVSDLKNPRNRCMYNIKSALWAAEHFTELVKFKSRGRGKADTTTPGSIVPLASPNTSVTGGNAKQGDKYLCDTCSLQNSCKYYRAGSVCTVPGSEPSRLASQFNTRDADTILGGLGALLASQANRLERGMEEEIDYGELDPEVTRIAGLLLKGGKDLAKLLNPALRAGPSTAIQINTGGAAASIGAASPNQVVASMVAELEARGIKRADITPAMIEGLLAEMAQGASATKAIEAHVVATGSDT